MNCLAAKSGGALAYLRCLVPALAGRFEKSRPQHHLTVLADEAQLEIIGPLGSIVREAAGSPHPTAFHRILWELTNVPRVVARHEAEVVFVPYQIGSRIPGARQVLMLRNMEPFFHDRYSSYSFRTGLRNRILRTASRRSLRGADRVIAVSDFAGQYAVANLGVAEHRIRKIYHGRPPSFVPDGDQDKDIERLAQLGISGKYVFTSGSLLPYRRCEDVISAFSRGVAPGYREARLVIAGSGSDQSYGSLLRHVIAESGCADQILALGQVPQDLMKILYRRCRYFVAATEVEACPNTLLEAMASGCPILYANTPPLPELLGEAGLCFTPRSVHELGDKMKMLWTNEGSLRALRGSSIQRAGDFSWSQCADSTFDALVNW